MAEAPTPAPAARALWNEVDGYIGERLVGSDPDLEAALEANVAAGLPAIDVSPPQGKQLSLLAAALGARRILEIGTLGGYSTIWLARGMQADGSLVTLEINPEYARVAEENIARAGLAEQVEVRIGPAAQTLEQLVREGAGPFDLTFIDADKQSTPVYFEWVMKLSRPGSVIVIDNVVRDGAVLDPQSDDPIVTGVRRFFDMLAAESRVSATAIQTVGSKGHDGFAMVLVNEPAS